ncbi:fimbria/pilus outer membrane usher protein [Ramlibacter humi]|uniref:Fimbrial biogenesis outer membrane usher protein n=1 Tax=Ramlibacter humi TaxID=2530451 RepID=A0A4Z0BNC9_9BURK|nr:fimbria/pilus outer membrane usher protein [Ramlibacter humi]TFZ00272.1 fimbrial biogenesis outer membrane usher protein [Ramlibacter humi]
MPRSAARRSWLLLLCIALAPSLCASAPPAGPGTPDGQRLYLNVVLNEVPHAAVYEVLRSGDDLFMSAPDLQHLGLRVGSAAVDRRENVRLRSLPGAAVHYDIERQQLRMTVPAELLDSLPLRLTIGLQPDAPPQPSQRVEGVLLNYDLFGQSSATSRSLGGQFEVRAFTSAPGIWTQGFAARAAQGDGAQGTTAVRLDSSWRHAIPETLASFSAGDTITSGLSWTRSMRIGGIQLGRDLGLQPYRPTSPLLSLAGETALPSTVELFVNGVRQMNEPVRPGQFQIDAVPFVTGAGHAQVLLTDMQGRVQRTELDFYAAPTLLRESVWDGSVEWGYPRRNYGTRSADYTSHPVGIGTGRYGFSDTLTLEGHGETGRDLVLGGIGALYRLSPRVGVAGLSLARSDSPAGAGWQRAASYQFVGPALSVTGSLVRRSSGFRDAASQGDGPPPRALASLTVGAPTPMGHASIGWASQSSATNERTSVLSASLTRSLEGAGTFQLIVLSARGAGLRSRQVTVTWTAPLDGRRSLSSTFTRTDGRDAVTLQTNRDAAGPDDGVSYRLQASADGHTPSAHAQVSSASRAGQWTAGAISSGRARSTLVYAGLDGSLLVTAGRVRTVERVDDAFAVVSTSGVPGIPVRLENRPVGVTDGTGTLVVPRLNAYQRNRLSIDVLDLPADYRIDEVSTDAIPERRSGVTAAFALRRARTVELTVVDGDGSFLTAGTEVELASGGTAARAIVGQDGFVYADGLADGPAMLTARSESCRGAFTVASPALPGPTRATVTCKAAP